MQSGGDGEWGRVQDAGFVGIPGIDCLCAEWRRQSVGQGAGFVGIPGIDCLCAEWRRQ